MSKKVEYLIVTATGLLLVYSVVATLPIAFAVVFAMFIVTSTITIWMVIAILKDKHNLSHKKFDDFFYEDSTTQRTK
ncbi:MAG: hypothetical protein ACKO96_05935 [Flammeovirgaceae bacterium]